MPARETVYVRPRPTSPAFSSVQERRKEEREEWVGRRKRGWEVETKSEVGGRGEEIEERITGLVTEYAMFKQK